MSQSTIVKPSLPCIKEFRHTDWPGASSVTIPLSKAEWQSGIMVGNFHGAGNYCYYIYILTTGDVHIQSLIGGTVKAKAQISGNDLIISGNSSDFVGISTLTLIGMV